jgi:hypothetical protein
MDAQWEKTSRSAERYAPGYATDETRRGRGIPCSGDYGCRPRPAGNRRVSQKVRLRDLDDKRMRFLTLLEHHESSHHLDGSRLSLVRSGIRQFVNWTNG